VLVPEGNRWREVGSYRLAWSGFCLGGGGLWLRRDWTGAAAGGLQADCSGEAGRRGPADEGREMHEGSGSLGPGRGSWAAILVDRVCLFCWWALFLLSL